MSTNWCHLRVSMPSPQSPPDLLTSQSPCLKNWSPTLCIRVWTDAMILQIPQMSHKEMTSTLCQTPLAQLQLRCRVGSMRQCIVKHHSTQMHLEISWTRNICSLMPLRAARMYAATLATQLRAASDQCLRNCFSCSPLLTLISSV